MKLSHYLLIAVLVIALVFGISPTVAAKGKPGGGGGKPPKDPPPPANYEITFVEDFKFGPLSVMNADGSNKAVILQPQDQIRGGFWVPGSNQILFWARENGSSGLYTIDIEFGESSLKQIIETPDLAFGRVSPDGQLLGFTGYELEPALFFFSDWACLVQSPGDPRCVAEVDTWPWAIDSRDFSWSPSSDQIVAKVWDQTPGVPNTDNEDILIFDVVRDANGFQLHPVESIIPDWPDGPGSPVWSPDGWYVAFNFEGDVYMAELLPDKFVYHNLTSRSDLFQVLGQWSPCGDQLVIQEIENIQSLGGSRNKLAILTLALDGQGDLTVERTRLPSSKKEDFIWPDWKPGPCVSQ